MSPTSLPELRAILQTPGAPLPDCLVLSAGTLISLTDSELRELDKRTQEKRRALEEARHKHDYSYKGCPTWCSDCGKHIQDKKNRRLSKMRKPKEKSEEKPNQPDCLIFGCSVRQPFEDEPRRNLGNFVISGDLATPEFMAKLKAAFECQNQIYDQGIALQNRGFDKTAKLLREAKARQEAKQL